MSGISLFPGETNVARIVQAILALTRGASNAVGTVTLRTGQTTTVVSSPSTPAAQNVSSEMQVFLTPRTAHAAAILASVYISAVGQQSFTITHPSSANADLTFGWEATG